MRSIVLPAGAVLLMLTTGCLREELPVPARVAGAAVEAQVCVGADYGDQVWYDIGTNTEVSRNSKFAWDLAFEGHANGWQVRLNSSRLMRAIGSGQTDITLATDTAGYGPGWQIDMAGGSRDSVALGDWREGHQVYVVDMGYNASGLPAGLMKVQVLSVDASGYLVRTARINGTGMQEVTVPKDAQRRFVHFHIISATSPVIAPPDGAYDLVFTQYTTLFHEPYMPYLVTGILNGFSGVRVSELISTDLESVSLDDTLAHPLSAMEDVVGYDWKEYSFNTSSYVIYTQQVYIVQDAEGFFHKFHFVDFYGPSGQRGCPTFEVITF